jgi:hypothetical protein
VFGVNIVVGFASGRSDKVPWKLIKLDPCEFVDAKYLPRNTILEDPSDMKKDVICRLLQHWRRGVPASDLFRFKRYIVKGEETALAKYNSKTMAEERPLSRPAIPVPEVTNFDWERDYERSKGTHGAENEEQYQFSADGDNNINMHGGHQVDDESIDPALRAMPNVNGRHHMSSGGTGMEDTLRSPSVNTTPGSRIPPPAVHKNKKPSRRKKQTSWAPKKRTAAKASNVAAKKAAKSKSANTPVSAVEPTEEVPRPRPRPRPLKPQGTAPAVTPAVSGEIPTPPMHPVANAVSNVESTETDPGLQPHPRPSTSNDGPGLEPAETDPRSTSNDGPGVGPAETDPRPSTSNTGPELEPAETDPRPSTSNNGLELAPADTDPRPSTSNDGPGSRPVVPLAVAGEIPIPSMDPVADAVSNVKSTETDPGSLPHPRSSTSNDGPGSGPAQPQPETGTTQIMLPPGIADEIQTPLMGPGRRAVKRKVDLYLAYQVQGIEDAEKKSKARKRK